MLTESRRAVMVFAAFLLASFAVRSLTFFLSQVGGDESLYLLIARGLLHGQTPYVDIVDNKPPGIYLVFALSQLLFGERVLGIRIVCCLANAASCWLLWRIGRALKPGSLVGAAAGVLFLFFSVANVGLEANTEIFYIPCVLFAFQLLVLREGLPTPLECLLAGLVLGFALQLKYVVVFDCTAAALVLGFNVWKAERSAVKSLALRWTPLVVGALVPLAAMVLWFVAVGHLRAFLDHNVRGNLVHRSDNSLQLGHVASVMKDQVRDNLFLWLGSAIAAFYAWRAAGERDRRWLMATLVWLGFAFLGVSFTKAFYVHYFQQLLPAQCLLAAFAVDVVAGATSGATRTVALTLMLLVPIKDVAYLTLSDGAKATWAHLRGSDPYWHDTPAEIADYLKTRVLPDQIIYVADYKIIINYLVPSKLPTRYMFPDFLWQEHFAKVAGVDPVAELDSILAKRPIYVVRRREGQNPFYRRLDEHLKADYVFERAFEERFAVDWKQSEEPVEDRYIEVYRLR